MLQETKASCIQLLLNQCNELPCQICDVHYIENVIVKIRLKKSSQNTKSNVGPEINRHNNDMINFFFYGERDLVSYDLRSYERNLCNCVYGSLKNSGLQQGSKRSVDKFFQLFYRQRNDIYSLCRQPLGLKQIKTILCDGSKRTMMISI